MDSRVRGKNLTKMECDRSFTEILCSADFEDPSAKAAYEDAYVEILEFFEEYLWAMNTSRGLQKSSHPQ